MQQVPGLAILGDGMTCGVGAIHLIGLAAVGAGIGGITLFRAGGSNDITIAGSGMRGALLPVQHGIAAADELVAVAQIRVTLQRIGISIGFLGVAVGDDGTAVIHAAEGRDGSGAVAVCDGHCGYAGPGRALCHTADTAHVATAGDKTGVIAAVDGRAAVAAEHTARIAAGGGNDAGVIAAGDGVVAAGEAADDAAYIAAAGDVAIVGAVADGGIAGNRTHDAAYVVAGAVDGHIAEAVFDDHTAAAGITGDGTAAGGGAPQSQILNMGTAADLLEQTVLGVQVGDLMALAIQLDPVIGGDIQPDILAQVDIGGQHAGDIRFRACIHEPGQLRAGSDLIDTVFVLLGPGHGNAVPGGGRGGVQGDLKGLAAAALQGDGAGGVLHARAGDGVGIGLGHGLEGAVLIDGNYIAVAVRQGDGQLIALDGAAIAALEDQGAGDELGFRHGDRDLGQAGQNAGNGGRIKAFLCTLGVGDAAVGGNARPTGLLDGAGQTIGVRIPIFGDGDLDQLADRVAAEVIYTPLAAGIRPEIGAVLALVIQGEVEVIRTGQLLLGADKIVELQIDGVAGLDAGLFLVGQDIALCVHLIIADATGGDDLIVGLAVLFHLNDVAAAGQAGDGDGAVLGNGHALTGEAVEGHGAAHGGAGHGDGAAFLRLEAVGRAFAAQIEQDVMLGVQLTGLVLGNVGIHAVQYHVGLDRGAVVAHGDDEHTGQLRPDGGKYGVVAHTVHMGHGVIGHQHDGGALMLGGHGGHVAVFLVGGDGHHVTVIAVDVDDLIVHVGQRHLSVADAFDGEPVAEGIQFKRLAHGHVLVALGVDVQVDARAVIHVFLKTIDRALVEAVVIDVQVGGGHFHLAAGIPFGIVPVGDAVGVLHPIEIVGVLVQVIDVRRFLAHRVNIAVHIVVCQCTHRDGGAFRHLEGDRHELLAGEGKAVIHGGGLCCRGGVEVGVFLRGCGGSLHGVAQHKDTGIINLFPCLTLAAGGRTQLRVTLVLFNVGELHGQGVVLAQDPIGGRYGDLIHTLDLEAVVALVHCNSQTSVAFAVFVIALDPILAGSQGDGIGTVDDFNTVQQIGDTFDTVVISVKFQGSNLRAVNTTEGHICAG